MAREWDAFVGASKNGTFLLTRPYMDYHADRFTDHSLIARGDDGRILVRESGTEPVIRVMVEAATDELCEKYVNQVIDVIKKEGLMVG